MRRFALVLGVALLLGLAGCAEFVGDTDDIDTGEDGTDGEITDDGTDTDTADDTTPPATDVDGELALHHLDVGQADAAVLVTPAGETILIDSGDWRQDGEAVIEYLEALGIDRIDHLVATHPHADHIGGHAAVIEHFETERDGVGAAYDAGVPHDTRTYERYLDAIEEHDVDLLLVEEGDELPVDGDVSATVLNPPVGDSGSNLHDNSVALSIDFGEFRYLTTGDAERTAEERLVEEWAERLDADVYQAGHHGSSTSSTAPFVDTVDPDIAIISSAQDSQFGHPHDEVLATFANRDIETYWTGVHGDIVVTTDGEDIDVATAEAFPTDPDEMFDAKGESSALAPPATLGPVTDMLRTPIPG